MGLLIWTQTKYRVGSNSRWQIYFLLPQSKILLSVRVSLLTALVKFAFKLEGSQTAQLFAQNESKFQQLVP
jgi:hypothetical protein